MARAGPIAIAGDEPVLQPRVPTWSAPPAF